MFDITYEVMVTVHRTTNDGHFRGFFILTEDNQKLIRMMDIYTKPSRRNAGLGRSLMLSRLKYFDANFNCDIVCDFDPDPDMDKDRMRNFFTLLGFKWDILYGVYRRKSQYVTKKIKKR